ncbi:MAG: EAL domain-containing protein [Pseudomonadota bacterium]
MTETLAPRDALRAIHAGRLHLAWQPVVRAAAPAVSSFEEGLARLRLPCGAILGAAAFVPGLEAAGAAAVLDLAALDQALRRLGRERSLRVSVNLSATSLGDGPWMRRLARGAAEDADACRRLIVEITETAACAPEAAVAARRVIGAMGPAVALDDFGSGHADAASAEALRPDILKIDASVIRGLREGCDVAQTRMGEALVLAESLEAMTVAEGVAGAGEAAALASLGIDATQGFGLAAPAFAAEVAATSAADLATA